MPGLHLLTCDLEPVRVLHGDVEGVDEVAGGKALVHTGRRRVHRDLGVGGLENVWRQSNKTFSFRAFDSISTMVPSGRSTWYKKMHGQHRTRPSCVPLDQLNNLGNLTNIT